MAILIKDNLLTEKEMEEGFMNILMEMYTMVDKIKVLMKIY